MTEISVAYYKKLYFGSRSMDKGILTSDLSISQTDWFQLLFIKKFVLDLVACLFK